MTVSDWQARCVVPGVYTDEYAPLVVISNQEIRGIHVIVWSWLRSMGTGAWVVHRCDPDTDFLDYRWKRTLTFGQSE